jgi:pantoate--beta-alanine ligase
MLLINSISEMKALLREMRSCGKSIGFVPTMGYMHEGHLTLIREAKKRIDYVVVSIFVNPLQFGVGEDFEEYPQDLNRDCSLAEQAGADVVFAPAVKEMYPKGYATFVEVQGLTDKLCGQSRPGHFRGVTTVVAKLFNIVEPDIAFFGQKDAQQVIILQKMVEDLNMKLHIEVVPTVREADKLAMSSRNTYLSSEERAAALVLINTLQTAKKDVEAGERSAAALKNKMTGLIQKEPLARIDYIDILSLPNLSDTENLSGKNLIAMAVFVGKTRLIDNLILEVQDV